MSKVTHNCCPKCGGKKFFAHQVVHINIIVDENCDFVSNFSEKCENDIYSSEKPFGPFVCFKCRAEYETLPIVTEVDENDLVAQVVKILQDSEHDVDEIIHDHFNAQASNVNNDGVEAQARFLLQEYDNNPETIKSILE